MFDQRLFDGCVKLAPGEELNETTVSLPASGGVCLFAGIEDQPILLVYGGNCRNLVRRRLADEDEAPSRRRGRLRPITACVWYRRAWSAFETQYAYMQIARAIYPDSYAELTRRAKAWFISLAARNGYRYLTVTDSVKGDLNDHWGPFATRKSAGSCLEILQDVFDLCRCPENLARAPKATPCAYAQMNRCAVFCDGSSSQDLCNELVGQAVKCLDEPAESAAKMERQMKASADARQYESAEGWKSKAGRVRKLCAEAFAWVRRLDRFYIFSFQPGPPMKEPKQRGRKSTVSTFVIGPGRVSQLEPFELDHAADRCRAALDHLRLLQMQPKRPAR